MNLWHLNLRSRRSLFFSIFAGWLVLVALLLSHELPRGSMGTIDIVAVCICFMLLSFNSFSLLLFSFGIWLGRVRPKCAATNSEVRSRTALVMPIYHEDTDRVYAGVREIWGSAILAGLDSWCDFYFLSDSTDPTIREQENVMHHRLAAEFQQSHERAGLVFLIRRKERQNYKAGNIKNFLVNHGGAYDFMLVLDADSVMLGETIKHLILKMQNRPNLAMLQSVIIPKKACSLFARAMQYYIARFLKIYARGMYWFTGPESISVGNNILIRIAPFTAHCGLPIMPGKAPLGGPIISHDIVESALLARAGWQVEWDVWSGGSFDELPTNILTYAERDRRWCQGNFQNLLLAFGDRMKLGHRIFLCCAVMMYLSGPLLLCLLLLGFIQGVRGHIYQYEPLMFWSFAFPNLSILVLPKVFDLLGGLCGRRKKSLMKETLSAFLHVGLIALICPSLYFLQARFILAIVSGKTVTWKNQARDAKARLPWSICARTLWLPTLLGLVWFVAAVQKNPHSLGYLLPILAGWIFAIPLGVLTSSPLLGKYSAAYGLYEDEHKASQVSSLEPLAA